MAIGDKATEGKKNTSDNNMKIAVTIIIILVGLLAVAIFALQQNKNDDVATSNTAETNTTEGTQGTSDDTKDAGSLGENEVKLTDDNFKAEVEDYQGVFLVEFYLSTCPHCQNVAEDVTAASDELVGKAKVGKMDARANDITSNKYNIESVPTLIVFKNGEEVERVSGEKTKDDLVNMVNKYL